MPDLDELAPDQQLALRSAAAVLMDDFEGIFGKETIERFLASSYEIERRVRQLLDELAIRAGAR